MQEIPISATPNQILRVVLANQNFQINIAQKEQGVFVDVNVNGDDISNGIIARDVVPIIQNDYAGVQGNLLFLDTYGSDDPSFAQFGTRFKLIYLEASEYALIRE